MPKLSKNRHAREKTKNSLSTWSQSSGWKGRRTMEEKICGKIFLESGVEDKRS